MKWLSLDQKNEETKTKSPFLICELPTGITQSFSLPPSVHSSEESIKVKKVGKKKK